MSDTRRLYITTPSHEEPEKTAETVLTERLAACANILEGVTSIFYWEGTLCRETEAVLIPKTADTGCDTSPLQTQLSASLAYKNIISQDPLSLTKHDADTAAQSEDGMMFRQRGAGAIAGAPLLRPTGRF